MPYNGSGGYTLPLPAVISGTTVESSWANTTLDDVKTALSAVLVRDGQAAMTGNLQMGSNRITGLANGSAASPALRWGTNIGWWYDGSGAIKLSLAGVEVLSIAASSMTGTAAPGGSNDASALTTGTLPSGRLTGAYTGINQIASSLAQSITLSGGGALTATGNVTGANLVASSGGQVYAGAGGWFRSNGAVGWYNDTYGAGIYATDSTYIRIYGSRSFIASGGRLYAYDASGYGLGRLFIQSGGSPPAMSQGDICAIY